VDGDPSSALNRALTNLKRANDHRAARTQEWAKEIERLSSGKIKALVDVGGDLTEVKDAIDFVAGKTGFQEVTRLKQLEEALGDNSAADILDRLVQPGGPLIIDQSEGDLDNKIIADLTDKLHSAKQNRQLIFASHNATSSSTGHLNLVGYLDVKESGDRSVRVCRSYRHALNLQGDHFHDGRR
jgi:hypothetical protein